MAREKQSILDLTYEGMFANFDGRGHGLRRLLKASRNTTSTPENIPKSDKLGGTSLSETELEVLKVLNAAETPLSGKEISKRIPKPFGTFNSSFKQTLSSLNKRDLIHNEGRGRAATGYTITDKGREALLESD